MIWDTIRRHQPQVEMFRRAILRGRTAHAYLFVGPAGIGKGLFARTLTQCLFCENHADEELEACGECSGCKQVMKGSHPDLLTIGCPEGKRELPIELLIGSPERRGKEGLCHDLSLRPMSASRRIAIIDDAEKMNEASANALLKTLEEPPPGAILILLTPDTDPILPTIRSRCQPVRFSPLSPAELTELLLEMDLDVNAAQAEMVAALAEGSLETARQLLDPGLSQLREVVSSLFRADSRATGTSPAIAPLKAVQLISGAIEELGTDTATQRRSLQWVLRFTVNELSAQLRQARTAAEADRLGALLDRCFVTESHLRQSMPVTLCLEAMFSDMSHV